MTHTWQWVMLPCTVCVLHPTCAHSFQSSTTFNEKKSTALCAAVRPSVAAQGSALMHGSVRVVMCLKRNPKLLLWEELFSDVGVDSGLWMS